MEMIDNDERKNLSNAEIIERYRDVIIAGYEENKSANITSKKWRLPLSSTINFLKREGVYKPPSQEIEIDMNELKKDVLKNKMSLRKAGEKYGCSHETIRKKLRSVGVVLPRKTSEAREHEEEIVLEYLSDDKLTVSSLAEKYECSIPVITDILVSNDVQIRQSAFSREEQERAYRYLQFLSAPQVGEIMNMHKNTVLAISHRFREEEGKENLALQEA